jgi:hypothetical protein
MTISAKKILHSISPQGIELKTALARYPRFIHAEELTHRILSTSPDEIIIQTIADGLMYDRNLSRNASSSRAIPVKRLIDDIMREPAMPISWGKNQRGMQAGEEWNATVVVYTDKGQAIELSREDAWLLARDRAVEMALAFDAAGYHKQVVNRLLEPFAHINVLITATDWDNFFELRDHKDAQPEIEALAKAIKAAFEDSEPELLQPGEWHLPFITTNDVVEVIDYLRNRIKINPTDERIRDRLIKISVARCARTSYLTHEGTKPTIEKDLELYDRLVGARPLHASPAEHQATPDVLIKGHEGPYGEWRVDRWQNVHLHGNFRGYIQNRKIIERQMFREAA